MRFDTRNDTIFEVESEGGELTVELTKWYAKEKAARSGRFRVLGVPEDHATMSKIAETVARQRGLYLAEEIDQLVNREPGNLHNDCRDVPVLQARGGLVYVDPKKDYESRQDTRYLSCDSKCFRRAPAGVGDSRRPVKEAAATRTKEGEPLQGVLTWRYHVLTDRFITSGPGAPPWETVVKREVTRASDGVVICAEDIPEEDRMNMPLWDRPMKNGNGQKRLLQFVFTYSVDLLKKSGHESPIFADTGSAPRPTSAAIAEMLQATTPAMLQAATPDELQATILDLNPGGLAKASVPDDGEWEPLPEKKAGIDCDLHRRIRENIASKVAERSGHAAAPVKHQEVVKLWLVDTGCGHDLVSREHARALKRGVKRASKPIQFATANGSTDATEVLELFINEFNQEIEPYILENSPDVISVGMRCMKYGFSFIWPSGSPPYFIIPDGRRVHLSVEGDIPYLAPGTPACKPRRPRDKKCFHCGRSGRKTAAPASDGELATAGDPASDGEPATADDPKEERVADSEDTTVETLTVKQGQELRQEARSVYHLSCHKPKNPFCEACTQCKLTQPPRFKGSFHNPAERWGSHLTADFIVARSDFMMGMDGSRDLFVVKDLWSGLKHAFPIPTNDADNVIECMKTLAGDSVWDIHQMYSDNAKEIIKAMQHYHILCRHSQAGISKSNAVAERANRDVESMTRTLRGQAGLPACYWPLAAPCATFSDNVRGGVSHRPTSAPPAKCLPASWFPLEARFCSTLTRLRVPSTTRWSRDHGLAFLLGIP